MSGEKIFSDFSQWNGSDSIIKSKDIFGEKVKKKNMKIRIFNYFSLTVF